MNMSENYMTLCWAAISYLCIFLYIVVSLFVDFNKLYYIYRSSYLVWRQSGKPRGDVTECDMRISRLRFKYALRQCQNNDEIMRADALARSYTVRTLSHFGKESEV